MRPLICTVAFVVGVSLASAAHAQDALCPPGTVAIVKGNLVHCITIERKEDMMRGRKPGSKATTTKLFEASAAPYETMRYPTVGDWIFAKRLGRERSIGAVHVTVAHLPDPRYEFLAAFHELIEARLCQERGITPAQVDDWDMHHQDADEPGEVQGAPYFEEHLFAGMLERKMAFELGVDWAKYEAAIKELGK